MFGVLSNELRVFLIKGIEGRDGCRGKKKERTHPKKRMINKLAMVP